MNRPFFIMPEAPDHQPPVEASPPARPRATGFLHTLALVICIIMLVFDGLMAMGIFSTAISMLQFKSDPQTIINALPPVYAQMPREWFQQYYIPIGGWWLIGQVGSLLLVFGAVGFLHRKRWCVHPFVLGFGIHFVNLIVLSFALGPMMVSLSSTTGKPLTPEEGHVGAVIFAVFMLFCYVLFRGIPALILRASAGARWEEEFS
ncbi:MAG: hypothetical protein ACYC6A_03930 [Armatimonadota bacterium]